MRNQRKPVDKVSIDAAGSEKLSKETNDTIDQIKWDINIGNPRIFYVRITRKGYELKGTWARTATGLAGIIGIVKLLF
jgi:hypothetical protein